MKLYKFLILLVFMIMSNVTFALEYYGIEIYPNAKVISKQEGKYDMVFSLESISKDSFEKVLEFYKSLTKLGKCTDMALKNVGCTLFDDNNNKLGSVYIMERKDEVLITIYVPAKH